MNGVEILSSHPIYNTYLPGWCAGFALIALILFSTIGTELVANEHFPIGLTFVIIGVFSFIVFMALSLSENKAIVAYWKHKVIIDDSVSMTEFMEKYEPIEQDGKIWIVKEK